MAVGNFGTAINCMDGRAQLPIIEWMKEQFNLDYVDMITEAGPDKVVSAGSPEQIASVLNRVKISVEKHGSKHIVITGHDDCAGNPVLKAQHIQDIIASMQVIRGWDLPASIYGVWINENWQIELIDKIIKL
jgi:carbonic anhydrase